MVSKRKSEQDMAMGIYRSNFEPMDQYVNPRIFAETCQYYVDEISNTTDIIIKNDILTAFLDFVSDNFYWFKLERTFQKNLKNLMKVLYYDENCPVVLKYYTDFYGEKI